MDLTENKINLNGKADKIDETEIGIGKENISNKTENQKKSGPFKRIMDPNFEIVKHGRKFAIAPIAIILVGILVILIFGLNLGLDFTGGRIIKITNFEDIGYDNCKSEITQVLKEKGINTSKVSFQREESTSGGTALTVKFPDPSGLNEEEIDDLNAEIRTMIAQRLEGVIVEPAESISASASSEKMMNVFIAITAALIGILIYMLFRFKLTSGIAAIIALFHDVLIMISLVAVFRIQVNFVFVAAIITIIGYSLNNTLVLFDRVRDKEKETDKRHTVAHMVDSSIKETMGRTMTTTITTLVPIFILAILGVSLIREFAIPIVFGLIAGTYSSVLLAPVLYVRFENSRIRKEKSKKSIQSKI